MNEKPKYDPWLHVPSPMCKGDHRERGRGWGGRFGVFERQFSNEAGEQYGKNNIKKDNYGGLRGISRDNGNASTAAERGDGTKRSFH
jgi:hypothetical protein